MERLQVEQIEFLSQDKIQNWVQSQLQAPQDLLVLSQQLSQDYSIQERHWMLAYLEFLQKAAEKWYPELWLGDKLALAQATAADLSLYKARYLKDATSLDDLCCGIGGDALFLPSTISIQGVDLSEARLKAYQHNLSLSGKKPQTSCENVVSFNPKSEFFCLDPDRRDAENNRRNWDPEQMRPSLAEVTQISQKYSGGLVKLPPAANPNILSSVDQWSAEYIGGLKDCRELLIHTGKLCQNKGYVYAGLVLEGECQSIGETPSFTEVEMQSGLLERGSQKSTWLRLGAPYEWLENLEMNTGPLQEYLLEPSPVLVRSHLFKLFVLEHKRSLLDPDLSWITSSSAIESPFFRNYRILDSSAMKPAKIKAMLNKFNIGVPEIKKRGIVLDPASEQKKFRKRKAKFSEQGVLLYTRIHGTPTVILAQRT